jgi:MscS family membrane protein
LWRIFREAKFVRAASGRGDRGQGRTAALGAWLLAVLVLSLALGSGVARADSESADAAEPDTPRRALERFLSHTQHHRFVEAARDLDLGTEYADEGPQLAQHLGAVLDRRLMSDPESLNRVSDAPLGELKDGLASDQEEVGRIPGAEGMLAEPVRLRRVERDGENRWVFSGKTVTRIAGWYSRLDDLWLREHLPPPLLRIGPRGFVLWEWLALPLLLGASVVLAFLLVWLVRLGTAPLLHRAKARWDRLLPEKLRSPMRLILTCALWGWAMPYLLITAQAERSVQTIARVGLLLGLFGAVWRCVDVVVQLVRESAWIKSHPAALGVIPLGYRLAEVTVVAIAVVTALQALGYPVTSLVAGLGIGGLAVALAAQKTVEHVFGGVMLSIDQPMRVGDLVRIDDTVGWVEHIGLRSTSIRTLERSLVTLPNGKLADMKIESLAARDRLRLHAVLGITYDLTADRLDSLRNALLRELQAHPKLWPGQPLRVHFIGFGDSSLDIEVMAWFSESDWERFLELRHAVLLQLLRIVAEQGAAFAFPTRTVRLIMDPGDRGDPRDAGALPGAARVKPPGG